MSNPFRGSTTVGVDAGASLCKLVLPRETEFSAVKFPSADVHGVRAYQAARAGIEWGAWQVLDPNHTLNPATCSPVVLPGCPAASTNLSGLDGSLSPFTVTVTCSAVINAPTTEGNREIGAYQIIATACNQPSAGACPNASPAAGYVERQLQATLSKCKDPTATAPRCACG